MSTGRRQTVLVAATALVVTAVALAFLALRPLGAATPTEAATRYESESGAAARVLTDREWGEGRHVLVRTRRGGRTYLSLSFVADTGRGWRVVRRAVEESDPSDIVVGSLLLASAPASDGQPAWTAAFGELSHPDIAVVEILWADGTSGRSDRTGDAYLVVAPGSRTAIEARFLDPQGVEVARVPASGANPAPSPPDPGTPPPG
ncbi:MAG TPA: hypothetical protein VM840_09375 [Actinomycetota bacterium]|nr:hypothetical protein [Actinomycetota bacterium]